MKRPCIHGGRGWSCPGLRSRIFTSLLGSLLTIASPGSLLAIPADELEALVQKYKQMTLDQLLDEPVSLVSRTPQPLFETPSAIQVITSREIERLPVTSLPEVLRLASNLQVAQVNSRDWAISARGFNNTLANKLLVMIDGRAVYTPLYAGVFWDVQNPLLADIDRIEVVSGPGGALWGANAVNGVINVVTRSARDTQGGYVSAGGGSFLQDSAAARYGGKIGNDLYYRVYAHHFDRNSTRLPDERSSNNDWRMTQGGFRTDWYPSDDNAATFQGDFYGGSETVPSGETSVNGQNVLGRWTHAFSLESDLQVQVYFDRTWRDVPRSFSEDLKTYDLDVQHRFSLGSRQSILWGAGYRFMQDRVENASSIAFLPAERDLDLLNGFIQDEIEILSDRLRFQAGSRFEYNDFSGFEVQPNFRAIWFPGERQAVWGAISRAVRSPSRIDTEVFIPAPPVPPGTPRVEGGPGFDSEELTAYELGYRIQPIAQLSLALATYYHRYHDLRSVNEVEPNRFVVQNDFEGEVWGVELKGTWQPTDWWSLSVGYNYIDKNLTPKGGTGVQSSIREGNDADHEVRFHSMMELPHDLHLGITGRYVDALPSPVVPGYFTLDLQVGWEFRDVQLTLIGQNLLDDQHPEFGIQEIPRSIFGKVTWRF